MSEVSVPFRSYISPTTKDDWWVEWAESINRSINQSRNIYIYIVLSRSLPKAAPDPGQDDGGDEIGGWMYLLVDEWICFEFIDWFSSMTDDTDKKAVAWLCLNHNWLLISFINWFIKQSKYWWVIWAAEVLIKQYFNWNRNPQVAHRLNHSLNCTIFCVWFMPGEKPGQDRYHYPLS